MAVRTRPSVLCVIAATTGVVLMTAACADQDSQAPELADVVPELDDLVRSQESVEFTSTVSHPAGPQTVDFTGEFHGTSLVTQDGFAGKESHLAHQGQLYFSLAGPTLVEHLTFLGLAEDLDVAAFAEAIDGVWFEEKDVDTPGAQPLEFLTAALRPDIDGIPAGTRAETINHEGEDAWLYRIGSEEIILRADPAEPLPLKLSGIELGGAPAEVEYRNWNEAELPEVPATEDLHSNDDFRALFDKFAL